MTPPTTRLQSSSFGQPGVYRGWAKSQRQVTTKETTMSVYSRWFKLVTLRGTLGIPKAIAACLKRLPDSVKFALTIIGVVTGIVTAFALIPAVFILIMMTAEWSSAWVMMNFPDKPDGSSYSIEHSLPLNINQSTDPNKSD